ncbi:MAG: hypothetical protein WBJ10_15960 [Daejeonella sp.]|uniref:hypothetical protein n=1 Tax=Daejeonella sp. TaxID=2805397 RepID=UPI003C720974
MKKLKTDISYLNSFDTPMDSDYQISTAVVSTIIYNPIYGINYEEFGDANKEQRDIFLKSKCREAEIVIATLSQMFEGEISTMNIENSDFPVACILKTNKTLTENEINHILSISRNLQII